MEKQLNLFVPGNNELDGLDKLISKFPELQQLIEDNDYNLDLICNGTKGLKGVSKHYKEMIMNFFKSLSETHIAKEVYKFANFKNQETIERLMEERDQLKGIITRQAEKHNDNAGIEEMNKMFSTMVIKTEDNRNLSRYLTKRVDDIKIIDDFKPIFEKPGMIEYSKEELVNMKKNKKGLSFKDVESITVVNIPKGKKIVNGKAK